MDQAGFPLKPFDFRVPGVMSMSCDMHKVTDRREQQPSIDLSSLVRLYTQRSVGDPLSKQ